MTVAETPIPVAPEAKPQPQQVLIQVNAPQSNESPGSAGTRCRVCSYTGPPFVRDKVSTAGWVVFTILLLTTVFLFWIGLLIRENTFHCRGCGARLF